MASVPAPIVDTLPDTVSIDREGVLRYLGFDLKAPATQAAFLICQRYGLDPVLKHVVMIQGRPYITRDGLLHVAHASKQLDGIVLEDQGETPTHHTAMVSVYRKDMRHPFKYPGRYPKSGGNKVYGPEMAIKCAEVMALRRAFDVDMPTEVEAWDDSPEPAKVVDNGTGHGSGKYATPAQVAAYEEWADDYCNRLENAWGDRWQQATGDLPGAAPEFRTTLLSLHLIRWGVTTGRLAAGIDPSEVKNAQQSKYAAILFARDEQATKDEAKVWAATAAHAANERLKAALPAPEREPGED
jgi:hypothetical protein